MRNNPWISSFTVALVYVSFWQAASLLLIMESRVLARPYLIMSYVIFPIHVNFPITSSCVLEATIHRKITVNCFMLLEKIFFLKKKTLLWYFTCMLYLINFFILSQSVPISHVSLSNIYQLFSPDHVLYTRVFLNICKGFFL